MGPAVHRGARQESPLHVQHPSVVVVAQATLRALLTPEPCWVTREAPGGRCLRHLVAAEAVAVLSYRGSQTAARVPWGIAPEFKRRGISSQGAYRSCRKVRIDGR